MKWVFLVFAIIGVLFAINAWYPALWSKSFALFGAHIPYAFVVIGGVIVLGVSKLHWK